MNEEEVKAIKFSEKLDTLLAKKTHLPHKGETTGDNELLALAGQLQAVDVTSGRELQAQLRRELLQQLELKRTEKLRHWSIPQLFPTRPRLALWVVVLLIAFFALLFASPGGRSAVAAVQNIISELRWENTTVQQVLPDSPPENLEENRARFERERAAGRAWSYSFEGSGFAGCCADGMRNEIVPLDQALTETGYTVQLPGIVPDGFALTEVRLLGVPPYDMFVIYEGSEDRLGLYQSIGGVIGREQVNETVYEVDARAFGVITDGSMEEIAVGDVTAALLDGYELVWEENGITFHLIGPGLDVNTLVQIAESLEPAG